MMRLVSERFEELVGAAKLDGRNENEAQIRALRDVTFGVSWQLADLVEAERYCRHREIRYLEASLTGGQSVTVALGDHPDKYAA
ncbi:hypothetical protein BH23ACT4_BH23ACT4_06370 [soil metagenome]